MKKKRGKKLNLSNRWLHTFIILGILAIISVGVYAYGTSSPSIFGHSGGEINVDNTFCNRITGHNCGYDTDNDYCSGGTCGTLTATGGSYGLVGDGDIGVFGYGSFGVAGYGSYYDFFAMGPGANYGSSSSIRWKNNITGISNALETIMNLRGVYFNWDKEHGGEHDMGFIAEEIGDYVPEIVGFEDATDKSNWYIDIDGNEKLYATGVDYGALTPVLVEAIKEQQKIIDNQKSEINSLDEKLNKICSATNLCD